MRVQPASKKRYDLIMAQKSVDEKIADHIENLLLADSGIADVSRHDLLNAIEEDIDGAFAGGDEPPTKEELEALVMGDPETGEVPPSLAARFPRINEFLADLF